MSKAHLNEVMQMSKARAELYLHLAKGMVMDQFGPATEHVHTEVTVALATAMMQHEGAQIMADALREARD